jgi:lambda repressor-like predicted transcriptional regulator
MNKEDLKAEIRKACGSLAWLSASLGVNPSLVSNVVAGRDRSTRVEVAISKTTGIPLAKIWPQYYQ